MDVVVSLSRLEEASVEIVHVAVLVVGVVEGPPKVVEVRAVAFLRAAGMVVGPTTVVEVSLLTVLLQPAGVVEGPTKVVEAQAVNVALRAVRAAGSVAVQAAGSVAIEASVERVARRMGAAALAAAVGQCGMAPAGPPTMTRAAIPAAAVDQQRLGQVAVGTSLVGCWLMGTVAAVLCHRAAIPEAVAVEMGIPPVGPVAADVVAALCHRCHHRRHHRPGNHSHHPRKCPAPRLSSSLSEPKK